MKTHGTAQTWFCRLTTSLFAIGLIGLVFAPFSQLPAAIAADQVALSGRIYNSTTGAGYAAVNLTLCSAGTVVTGANGNWQAVVNKGSYYCVRLADKAPSAPSGPIVRNNPEVGVVASYENQQAGVNCYQNAACPVEQRTWDRPIDGGLDFVYSNEPPAASVAVATPTPGLTSVGFGAPKDFVTKVSADNDHTARLQWAPAGDAAATKSYKLERSLDQVTWDILANELTETSYLDSKALPGVHYYYRLSAISSAGAASDYALADLEMGSVLSAADKPDGVYVSADGLARVTVPAGAAPDGTICSVNTVERPAQNDGSTTVVGPYELKCKNSMNTGMQQFDRSVNWQLKLEGRLQGYQAPQAVQQASNGQTKPLANAVYDDKTGLLTVGTPGNAVVMVLAVPLMHGWVGYAVAGGLVLIVIAILAFIPFRAQRKLSYQEYLRAKYYNL